MGMRPLRRRSLKTRVTLFTLLIFLASIWSLEFFVSHRLRDDIHRLLNKQQFTTVSFMAAEADRELERLLTTLGRTASLMSAGLLADKIAARRFLEDHPVLLNQFSGGLIVIGADGIAQTEVPASARRVGINYNFLEPVTEALNEGKSSISSPRIDLSLQTPVFSMAAPIRDEQGAVIGALAGVVDLARPNFLDQITERRYGESGFYLLEDARTRHIVTATGRTRLMEGLPRPGSNALIDRFVDGYDETGVMTDSDGRMLLASARRVPAADWFIVAALPEEEAFALITGMQGYMLQAAVVLTLLAGGLTWWMLRRELAPMLAAIRTLTALSDTKQPPQPLPNASHGEIGDLIAGFNRLLAMLGEREQALQTTLNFQQVLMEAVPSPLFYKDASGAYIGCNRAFEQYLGISRENLIGKTVYDIAPPDLAARYDAADRELLGNPGVQTYEASVAYADGSRHDVIFHKATFNDVDGRVAGQIGVLLDITERKVAEDRLKYLAFYDQLTGLPNRRLFNDRLQQAMAASKRNGLYGALMFLDLDNFKPLNDQHGHAVGDLLLGEVARRLKTNVREMDTVARFGGDEFVVMLAELGADPGEATAQAGHVGEKIRLALAEPYRLTVKSEATSETVITHRCTVSIGTALFLDHESNRGDILKRADAAMYDAKARGRDTVAMHAFVPERATPVAGDARAFWPD
ncbi:MAG: diguanylate cyclase [Propionivibrio sp.]|uniref:diguanylate cyclase n=1 Tax=Propionivibrio sp. TaxID=2212460 RepID=UPI001B7C2EB7|nr:diguanylate cyclase [Propionivibrio sp.]MBP7203017.1 diguanylate cyclase [Propionivibrio sp.]